VPRSTLAVIDERGTAHSYGALAEQAERAADAFRAQGAGRFGFFQFGNRMESLAAYLGCLQAGLVPLLLPESLPPEQFDRLISHYRPDWTFGPAGLAATPFHESDRQPAPHPELTLLLSTSGTTGSPRLVRLPADAISANAESIVEYLGLTPDDRAMTTLPPSYSYGLSVIHSHLAAGAALVLNSHALVEREFWNAMVEHGATSLAGVPQIYQTLERLHLERMKLPALRTLTQAGGRLDDRLSRFFDETARRRGWRFFVMYGQTEAAPRMSYVPHDRLADKIGSIGRAIPGGRLELDPANGEIVYHGANVMMGYAETRSDLARADELGGVLRTGDLGRRDDEGYFYITGRIKRFIKLSGNRISLDEIERILKASVAAPLAASGSDDLLQVWVEGRDDAVLGTVEASLRAHLGVHHSLYRLRRVDRLPLLPSGKTDYAALVNAS
jgi:acyl-CoA synthetase (AMP-forming)/AMP-acid ligase II